GSTPDAPNLLICVIDAARADHLGCYGYPRPTTPNMDRLAEESLLFENHFTQATETKLSTASLLTSQYVDSHLAFGDRPLPKSAFTMADGLRGAGFKTLLFSSNLQASPAYGIGTDFQEVRWVPDLQAATQPGETAHSPEVLLRVFRAWLDGADDSRFFAYMHLLPPHIPYEAPDSMAELFADEPPGYLPENYHRGRYDFPIEPEEDEPEPPPLPEWINLYDANLRYADWAVGKLCRLLEESDRLDNTILVITSDHGEAFGEHGFIWHAAEVHDEASRIPLLIRLPKGDRRGRVSALTQTIDLLPTLFELLQVPYPEDRVQGRSLGPLIDGKSDKVHEFVFTRARGHEGKDKYMIRGEQRALLLFANGEWRALYDLAADPEQRDNIIEGQPEVARYMLEAFRAFASEQTSPPAGFLGPGASLAVHPADRTPELSPELHDELRALGYLK
ncbi:MAG: sulfatase, partial [Armatimonadota bacterium]